MNDKPFTVARALSETLEPLLHVDGFHMLGSKRYVRPCDLFAQFIFIVVEQSKFFVEFGVMPLFVPSEHFDLTVGDSGRHYGAQPEARLRAALVLICQSYEQKYRPWFEMTRTLEGYAHVSRERLRISASQSDGIDVPSRPLGHHDLFRLGCCDLLMGKVADGRMQIERARDQYRNEADGRRTWAESCALRCDDILQAIDDGSDAEVLRKWTQQTAAALGLDKLKSLQKRGHP
jgi:hypothetical protein